MTNTSDYKIIKIEKKADVTKTVTSWKTVDQNGVHYNNSESYDTKLNSIVQYENGDTDLIGDDLEVTEGWTVRFVFINDEIYYKICIENNLILFAKKNPELIGTKVDFKKYPMFQEFVSPLEDKTKIDEDLSFEYNIPGIDEFVLYAKEKQVIHSEKISIIEKSGKTKINTRLYYDDNTTELFEDTELAIMPGWHIRDIFYHEKNNKYKQTPRMRKIWESNKILYKAEYPTNAYHFAVNLKDFPMLKAEREFEEKTKRPYNFFLFIFWLLLFGSFGLYLYVLYWNEELFVQIKSIKDLILNHFLFKGVPLYSSISVYVFIASILGIIVNIKLKKSRNRKIKALKEKNEKEYEEWKKANRTILRKVYDDYIQLANEEDETKKKE